MSWENTLFVSVYVKNGHSRAHTAERGHTAAPGAGWLMGEIDKFCTKRSAHRV